MLPTTFDLLRSALRTDQTVSTAERDQILRVLRTPKAETPTAPATPRVMRRHEVAKVLSRSLRSIDLLAKTGVLRKVVLPGRKRGAGFLATEVESLLSSNREKGVA